MFAFQWRILLISSTTFFFVSLEGEKSVQTPLLFLLNCRKNLICTKINTIKNSPSTKSLDFFHPPHPIYCLKNSFHRIVEVESFYKDLTVFNVRCNFCSSFQKFNMTAFEAFCLIHWHLTKVLDFAAPAAPLWCDWNNPATSRRHCRHSSHLVYSAQASFYYCTWEE